MTDWLQLSLVGAPATILSALTLIRIVKKDSSSDASLTGKLREEVSTLKRATAAISKAVQQHLIDCAHNQGRIEESSKANSQALERLERSVSGIQRMVANFMRSDEYHDGS